MTLFRIVIVLLSCTVLYLAMNTSEKSEAKLIYKKWVKIISVEEKKVAIENVGGYYLSWLVTVDMEVGQPVKVIVANNPIPKINGCLPIIVGKKQDGSHNIILDIVQWHIDEPRTQYCEVN